MNTRAIILALTVDFALRLLSSRANGKEVPLASLPEKTQQAVKVQVGKGALIRIEEDLDDGGKSYDVVFKRDNAERTLTFAEDGKLIHAQVLETELPALVSRVLHAEFKEVKPVEIYRVTEDNDPYFQFEFGGSSTNSLYIAESGRWWSLEISSGDAPAPVLAAIKQELGAGDLGSLSKTKEDGKVYFEVETGTKDGRDLTLNISPEGTIVSREEEVALNQIPAPAQKPIHARVGDGKLVSLTKRTVADGFVFDVEAKRNGKTIEFTVGPHGRIRTE